MDDNRELSCLPASLLLSAPPDLTVGTQGCRVEWQRGHQRKVLSQHTPAHTVPPLLELVARTIHTILASKHCTHTHTRSNLLSLCLGNLGNSPVLWLPLELCSLLTIPNSLEHWLVPRGRCCRGDCSHMYFRHCYVCNLSDSLLLSLGQRVRPQHWGTGEERTMAVDFCCGHCAAAFFRDQSDLLHA